MRRLHPTVAVVVAVLLSLTGCAKVNDTAGAPASREPAARTADPDAASRKQEQVTESPEFKEFIRRVNEYVELHKRLESTLPPLPKETNPIIIDRHQRTLGKLIQQERKGARRGDIITPETEQAFRSVLKKVFGAPDGKQLKASIMDENPVGAVKLSINGRYPDEVPLSTVPPQVLAALPKLPADVEYRFVGDHLVLLDVHAHIIIDYIDRALPA